MFGGVMLSLIRAMHAKEGKDRNFRHQAYIYTYEITNSNLKLEKPMWK
jgi:hypothetical protein